MELQKSNNLSKAIQKMLIVAGLDINIGDLYIDKRGEDVIRITKIERRHNEYFEANKHDADYAKHHPKYSLFISYDVATNWEATNWSSYGSGQSISEFQEGGKYRKLTKSVSEYRQEALDVIEGRISINELSIEETESDNQNTSLISKSSKEGLIAIQKDMEQKKNRVDMIKCFVSNEMERRKQELDKIRDKLNGVLAVFKKQISRIMRVITTIELYLGIDEEIFQIQDGEKAPVDTPITFRQRVLYMDEEVANVDDGGLDFQDIEVFDNWLLENNNYKQLIPEIKGIVVFRPRRYAKDYGEDRYGDEKNMLNRTTTYLLIRNGDCLYRIFTDRIVIQPRLFPQRTELMKLLNEIDETESKYQKEEAQEKVEDLMYQYRKRAVLLQGLIDRTEILHPLPNNTLSIFKMDEAGDMFNFVYDDEASLPDGRLPFWDWVKQNNKKIGVGSRILMTGNYNSYSRSRKDFTNYIFLKVNEYNMPELPKTGVYEVEKFIQTESVKISKTRVESYLKENEITNYKIKREYQTRGAGIYCELTYQLNEEHLTIMYNPKDSAYRGWGAMEQTERKNRIRFKIDASDSWVLNYDQISLDDIDFYLQNRADRENYLDMMPLIRNLKKWRLVELENEKHFVKMVIQQITSTTTKKPISELEKKVWEAVEWWKFKNKFKRPIDKDDTKALRMIQSKIINANK